MSGSYARTFTRTTGRHPIEAYRRGFTATYVAGFRAWLQLNRVPRRGEGIRILAPVIVKDRDE
jgi:hypothetical protein